MRTKAAIIREPKQDGWEVVEVALGDPRVGEVQVKLAASGLCHSDEHLLTGDLQFVVNDDADELSVEAELAPSAD